MKEKEDLNWWQKLVVLAIFVAVMFAAVIWGTAPEQWYAGDLNYDELVNKASHK